MKNKIFSIILSMFLILPINAWAVEDTVQYDSETQQAIEDIVENQQLDEDGTGVVEEEQAPQTVDSPYKQPISKKKLVKKFLLAMFGVIISSLVLYLGLTLYNKIRNDFANQVKTPEGETPLTTPSDIEGAVRTFLDKTKW